MFVALHLEQHAHAADVVGRLWDPMVRRLDLPWWQVKGPFGGTQQ